MKRELCAASVEAIQLARELNFDRIELCQNLEQGGITPSPGFIEYALAFGLETHVLIRPRSGGFHYSVDEFEIILRDIQECSKLGVHGVVIGTLNEYGAIDREGLKKMMDMANGIQITFHRAFDDCVDWKRGLSTLIEAGVDRVLSSGMARNAEIGIPILKEMKDFADGRIQIMAGGGVNAVNVGRIMTEANPDAIHFSGTVKVITDEGSLFSESILSVDANRVKRILTAIDLVQQTPS